MIGNSYIQVDEKKVFSDAVEIFLNKYPEVLITDNKEIFEDFCWDILWVVFEKDSAEEHEKVNDIDVPDREFDEDFWKGMYD